MKIILVISIFILSLTNIYGQNIYKDYNINDTIKGQKLTLGTNGFSYNRNVSSYTAVDLNLNGEYSAWKFTPKNLYFAKALIFENYRKITTDGLNLQGGRENSLYSEVYGGYSYYLNPNKAYLTASTILTYQTSNSDYNSNYSHGNGYLFGGLGYGRIVNSQGVEAAEYFSEALVKSKVTDKPLDKSTLLAIDRIIYKFRNGNYGSSFKDDAEIYLMKDIEKLLMEHNVITGKLDAESTMRLYTILTNRSFKFYYYPRYVGFQAQAEVQYHAFGNIKPKENFVKITGAYGMPLSRSTNLLLGGFYAQALNDDAGRFLQSFPPYSMLGYGEDDINNFNFSANKFGFGNFYNSVIAANNSIIGTDIYLTQSLSSTAGLFFRTSYYNYPKNTSSDIASESSFLFESDLSLSYNIYSKLTSNILVGYYKNEQISQESYVARLSFYYTIF
ncbi:MAG: hypothetical protein JST55_10535 [Bacteroidetes bacterium]|nr:hypothetical protein [Bacteroidota bacterium]